MQSSYRPKIRFNLTLLFSLYTRPWEESLYWLNPVYAPLQALYFCNFKKKKKKKSQIFCLSTYLRIFNSISWDSIKIVSSSIQNCVVFVPPWWYLLDCALLKFHIKDSSRTISTLHNMQKAPRPILGRLNCIHALVNWPPTALSRYVSLTPKKKSTCYYFSQTNTFTGFFLNVHFQPD